MEYKNSLGSRLQVRKVGRLFTFPSLFSRLVCVYISILVIVLIVLFITFTHSFQSYFVKYTQEIMINQAKSIADEYDKAGRDGTSKEYGINKIFSHIQIMNNYMQATTWIIDGSGTGYVVTEDNISFIYEDILHEASIQEVLSGRVIGFENGLKDTFSMPVLTIGYPMTLNGKIEYALFIHTPMPYILQTIDEVRNLILNVVGFIGSIVFIWIYTIAKQMTRPLKEMNSVMPYILQTIDEVRNLILNVVGFIGSIVFIWIYTIAKQMTRPLKEMNSVAKNIASGQFNERIEVIGNDEIAELGLSLNHMAEELDKIEENRRSFIANISHDLRSPLTSIQGFVTAMLDGTIDSTYQEKYLKIVLNETKRLITMTNTILDLSQMQERDKLLNKEYFNINTMIEQAISSLESRAKAKKISVKADLDIYHAWVLGEVDSINRVIQNLLDNAYKFVNEGGRVIVRTQYKKNKLWVSILNNGPAIPEEQQKLIWERFYKADCSRGQDKQGIGLGLVIVKEIMKKHDEVIGVHSKEGEDVEFYFSMSVIKDEE